MRGDGTIFAWGDNASGQLGDGWQLDIGRSVVPSDGSLQALDGVASWRSRPRTPAGVALTEAGEILRWGTDAASGWPKTEHPTRVELDEPAADVVAIAADTALTADGVVHRWRVTQRHESSTGASAGAGAAVGGSRLGGVPDLPAGVAWPQVDGRPLAFVAQLDLAELAQLDVCAALLPARGLLSLFVLPADIGFANTFRLLYTDTDATPAPAQPPDALADDDRFESIAVRAEPELSLPPLTSAAVWRLALSDHEREAYEAMVDGGGTPVHRVLGHQY